MILCSGCFDGIHAGHMAYLAAAERLLLPHEPLEVAVAPDAYIQAVKGRDPYWPEEDRAQAIHRVKGVTATYVGDPLSAVHRARLLVKGMEWAGRLPAELRSACHTAGCVMVYVETPGRHVSDVRPRLTSPGHATVTEHPAGLGTGTPG